MSALLFPSRHHLILYVRPAILNYIPLIVLFLPLAPPFTVVI